MRFLPNPGTIFCRCRGEAGTLWTAKQLEWPKPLCKRREEEDSLCLKLRFTTSPELPGRVVLADVRGTQTNAHARGQPSFDSGGNTIERERESLFNKCREQPDAPRGENELGRDPHAPHADIKS